MKGFCKRIMACFSVAAMLVATLGTAGIAAVQEAPKPAVSSWIENGTGYPRTAEMSISYDDGAAYSGKYSLIALYNNNSEVVGVGGGILDANGASNYNVEINAEGAETVKCFIWDNLSTVKPSVPVYETTYENFARDTEFYVPGGAFGIRNSFESGLFRIFQDQGTYDLEIAEDSSAAHTGTKYAKVSNRIEEKGALRLKVADDEIGANKKVNVSAYVKKPETVTGTAEFYVRTIVLKAAENGTDHVVLYSDPVAVTDNNWHKVTAEIDLSAADVPKHIGDCVIEIGARTGSADSYTYVDYCVDDFVITCEEAAAPFVFDDKNTDELKWTFEDGTADDLLTDNRYLHQIKDINKWTRVLQNQTIAVESASAETNAPTGSAKMLTVQTEGAGANAHITARIKVSKLDIVPGNTYDISFWARGNKKDRALYVGLIKQDDTAANPSSFYGSDHNKKYLAGGIVDYYTEANYTKNRAAILSTSWTKYTYTITPTDANFNSDGYANLCFVMTAFDPDTGKPDDGKKMLAEEKLYLDEIEITSGGAAAPSTNVPEFSVPATALGLRNSFESGLFQIFQNQKAASYSAEIVEDSSAAHTGAKYAKITGRAAEKATLRVKLPKAEISATTTVNVKAFMKKPENVEEAAQFYINIIVPRTAANGGTLTKQSSPVTADDNDWHEVSYALDLSTITNISGDPVAISGDPVVELGARTGSEGSYTYVDYFADDFTVICPNADIPFVFDDTKTDRLKWTFEGKTTENAVTTNRFLNRLYDTNKWTKVLKNQNIAVEDTSAETNAPTGSTKMLTVQTEDGANKNAHITARMKLSKLDIKPNKKYQISFWARGNLADRALYIGLLNHEDIENPGSFNGGPSYQAGGIVKYNGDYSKNRAAFMTTSWTKYTYTISTTDASFNGDGFADLYFVMVKYDADTKQPDSDKNMLNGEKLCIDEIEITEVQSSAVAAIENDGLYTKRATFESDNMDMFSPDTRSSVVLTAAEANTGSYSAEFADRSNNWTSLGSSLKGADLSSKITASCYLKKKQSSGVVNAQFRLIITGTNDILEVSDPVQLSDTEWTKLEWTFDLSKYSALTADNIGKTYIYIITDPITSAYYADDFMMKSDKAGDGTFYDDYNLPAPAAGISSTATGQTYFSADDVDVDTGITSLYAKYADKFKIGGTLANDIVSNSKARNVKIYEKLFKKHFNTTSSDGYFKMEEILKNPDDLNTYTFTNADKIMKFCIDNGVEVVGHALIWDKEKMYDYFYSGGKSGTPKYTRDQLLSFMNEYITKVMNHFNGKGDSSEYTVAGYTGGYVHTWDVLNEACDTISSYSLWPDGYRVKNYPFKNIIGEDYGVYAFKYAREADSEAELRYNDYGEQVPKATLDVTSKAESVVNYVNSLADPENPSASYVDTIGVQSHYDIESDIGQIRESLGRYYATGKKIDITELDIKAYTKSQRDAQEAIYEDGVPKTVEYKQAKLLRDLFDTYELYSDKIDRVNFWTFTDLYAYPNIEGFTHKEYAGIFDRKFAPKPQYYILVDTEEEFNKRYPDYQQAVAQ